jgi:hypothetical protein
MRLEARESTVGVLLSQELTCRFLDFNVKFKVGARDASSPPVRFPAGLEEFDVRTLTQIQGGGREPGWNFCGNQKSACVPQSWHRPAEPHMETCSDSCSKTSPICKTSRSCLARQRAQFQRSALPRPFDHRAGRHQITHGGICHNTVITSPIAKA